MLLHWFPVVDEQLQKRFAASEQKESAVQTPGESFASSPML
jgi:hypothetical protein